jgi:hypothetical protein
MNLRQRHAVRVITDKQRLLLPVQRDAVDALQISHLRHNLRRTSLSEKGGDIERDLLHLGRGGRLGPGPRLAGEGTRGDEQDRHDRDPASVHGLRSSFTSVPENVISSRIFARPVFRMVWYSPAGMTQNEPARI